MFTKSKKKKLKNSRKRIKKTNKKIVKIYLCEKKKSLKIRKIKKWKNTKIKKIYLGVKKKKKVKISKEEIFMIFWSEFGKFLTLIKERKKKFFFLNLVFEFEL